MNATKLAQIDLNTNRLQGTVPSLIGKLSSLAYLDISYNNFSGCLPSALCLPTLADLLVCGSHTNDRQGCGNLAGYPPCLLSLSAVKQLGNLSTCGTIPSPTLSPSFGTPVRSSSSNGKSFFKSGYGVAVIVVVVFVGVALISCGAWIALRYKESADNASSLCGGGDDTRSYSGYGRCDDSSIPTSPTLKQQEQDQQAFSSV